VKLWASRIKTRLERYALVRFAQSVAREWSQDDAIDRAGAVAFHAFLSIFPLLLGIIGLLGFFLPDADVRAAVSDTLTRLLPGSADLVEQNLDAVIELREVGGFIGLIGLVWSGSNLFAAIRRAVNRAWGVRKDRPFLAGKARDLALVAGTGILLLLSLLAVNLVALMDEIDRPLINMVVSIGSHAIGFILVFLVFLLVNKFEPNTRTSWRWVWPGALLAAVLFQAGTYVFIFYVANLADFESVYGPLGSVIALLIWIYYSSIILVLGVEVNSELHRISADQTRGT